MLVLLLLMKSLSSHISFETPQTENNSVKSNFPVSGTLKSNNGEQKEQEVKECDTLEGGKLPKVLFIIESFKSNKSFHLQSPIMNLLL